jgi:hypothetical protein
MILRTAGDGYWTKKVADVPITKFEIAYLANDKYDGISNLLDATHGELRVHFDVNAWQHWEDGLIYTDTLFLQMLKFEFVHAGFTAHGADDIGYSEQGMQGDYYVSFDIGKDFIRECDPFVNFVNNQVKSISFEVTA